MRGEIESESEFVWVQIAFLLKLPWTLLMILFGKERARVLWTPLHDLWEFMIEPKVTLTLVIANIVMFLLEIFYFTQEQLQSLAFQPQHLFELNFLPMVTSWFLHANLAHLAGNMLMLFILGRVVEKHFGSWKMFLFYFTAAIVSDIIAALVGQGGIGASGAIAGIISVAILVQPFYRTFLILGIPIPIIILGWLGILADITGILVPAEDNIGHWAHLGGYISVAVLAYFMDFRERHKMKIGLLINIGFVILVAIAAYYLGFNPLG